jgi:hypothetical protein
MISKVSNLDSVLEDCLERLVEGETLQACLTRYPEHAAELKPLLRAAALLEKQAQLRPPAAFKARTRAKLYAHMDAHPQKSRQWWKPISSISLYRPAFALVTLLLVFGMTGTALAQFALPGSAFYPWKLVSEQVWRVVYPDQVGFDISLAERRVDEAIAVSGNTSAQETAVKGYQRVVIDLEKYQDLAAQSRIQQALELQQERLQSTGLLLVDQGTSTPTNVASPTQIPVSTQKIPPLLKPTLIPSKLVPTQILPTQIPEVLPTTIKILPTTIRIPTAIKVPTLPIPLPTIPLGLP